MAISRAVRNVDALLARARDEQWTYDRLVTESHALTDREFRIFYGTGLLMALEFSKPELAKLLVRELMRRYASPSPPAPVH